MGTFYSTGATRQDIILELTASPDDCKTLKHCTRGNILWVVHHTISTDRVWLGCYILVRDEDGWGYKPVGEDAGPCYYTCPLSYLKLLSEPQTDTSKNWRNKVRTYHREARA